MPPVADVMAASRESNRRNKKSRNGCGRCKLKRLKCDETSPACMQCTKRNFQCPGYEKALKWSTKYEVFQPAVRLDKSRTRNASTKLHSQASLPPEVVSGIQAMVAVLPNKNSESRKETEYNSPIRSDSPIEKPNEPRNALQQVSAHVDAEGILPSDISQDSDPPLVFDVNEPSLDIEPGFDLPIDENFDLCPQNPWDDPEQELDVEEICRTPADENIAALTTAGSMRSLLLEYYRIGDPALSPSLHDIESSLVQHYFKDVCVLFSSFDSILNPFRTAIGRIFRESPSIYYAIQSMAAAHLANTHPSMTTVGLEMQRRACESLAEELPLVQAGLKHVTPSFLSIILLGMTTTWHESSELGEDFLATARRLIVPKLLKSDGREEVRRETQFFEESLIYWEMLMGFVTPEDALPQVPPGLPNNRGRSSHAATAKQKGMMGPGAKDRFGMIVPHPWTGIAPTIQVLFAEVGRLVRRQRLLHLPTSPVAAYRVPSHNQQVQENLLDAMTLEEDLLAAEYPLADELADPGDERTAKRDFVVMAEAYRCTGLLELYRVFPALLRRRLGSASASAAPWDASAHSEYINVPTPPTFAFPNGGTTDTKLWISSLALYILDLLSSLPSSSGTCCLQPILFVAAASELRYVKSVDYFDVYASEERIRNARAFVRRRLEEYAVRLPAKPIRRMIELVREVWKRLDGEGEEDEWNERGEGVFWIDVMVEKGWHTLMG